MLRLETRNNAETASSSRSAGAVGSNPLTRQLGLAKFGKSSAVDGHAHDSARRSEEKTAYDGRNWISERAELSACLTK